MRVLQYLFDLFFKIYALREFYTLSLSICYCLVSVEDNPDTEIQKKLDFIKENTHPKLMIPISTAELIILSNMGKGIGTTVEFKDNTRKTREIPLHLVIKYAKESYFELAQYVVQVAKRYSLDIPMKPSSAVFEIPEMSAPALK